MAVLKANPQASCLSFCDQLGSNYALALAERNGPKLILHAFLFCESNEVSNWISTRGEHKDDRGNVL